jgi:hypothetical protein
VFGLSNLPTSHKTDYTLRAEDFWLILGEGFLSGRGSNASYHTYILAVAVLVWLLHWFFRRKAFAFAPFKLMMCLLAINFALALIAALYNAAPGVWLRQRMAVLGTLQLTRVLVIAPALWYLFFAILLAMVLSPLEAGNKRARTIQTISVITVMAATVMTVFIVLMSSSLKPNLQKLLTPPYPEVSYRDYYALGVLEQVEDFISTETGLERADYRVASLGINPAAALYHGFYCLDGYSNNYPLEYKHAFRRVIAPELAKDEALREYYDLWGNRVYLFSAEKEHGAWPLKKGSFIYRDFQIDAQALYELGGHYLLSAAYIENAEATGLRLLRAEPFATADSYVEIYLYEVSP